MTTLSKTEKQHGGRRPGAGRKPKDRTAQDLFEDAESYLSAVVRGTTPADPVRVQAAKCLISFQVPKQRTKPKSPTPKKLAEKEAASIEQENQADFEKKAAKVREKFKIIQGENSK